VPLYWGLKVGPYLRNFRGPERGLRGVEKKKCRGVRGNNHNPRPEGRPPCYSFKEEEKSDAGGALIIYRDLDGKTGSVC